MQPNDKTPETQILSAFLNSEDEVLSLDNIVDETRLPGVTVAAILADLKEREWVDGFRGIGADAQRRYYSLNSFGRHAANIALAQQ